MKIQRLPYLIAANIWFAEFCEIRIRASNSSLEINPGQCFSGGLPIDFVRFFQEHGKCAFCGLAISANFERCKCGEPRDERNHLEILIPTLLYSGQYKKLFDREKWRVGSAKRMQMIRDNGGIFDRRHIKGMYKAQGGLCYFCGIPIELDSGSLHVDHYIPVTEGGQNNLSNMVLTCAKCNLVKNSMHGDKFDAVARKLRAPAFTQVLRAMRKNLKAYKREFQT